MGIFSPQGFRLDQTFNIRRLNFMTKKLLFPVIALILFCSCTPTRVVVEENRFDDFKLSDSSTFDFAQIDSPNDSLLGYTQIVNLLKETMVGKLESRGLTQDAAAPDLKINLGLVVEDKVQTRETNITSDPFTYSGQRNYNWEVREIPVNTYREGSLTVHFVNAAGNVLLWAGTISEVVPKKWEDKNEAVRNAVDQIFKYLDINNK